MSFCSKSEPRLMVPSGLDTHSGIAAQTLKR